MKKRLSREERRAALEAAMSRMRASDIDPRLQATAYGTGSLVMSLPFLGIGAFFSISSFLETDFIKEGANAPLWVIGVVGLIFFLAGLILFSHSIGGIVRRRAAESARRRHGNEPWRYDHPWSGFSVSDKAGSRAFSGLSMLAFLTLFLLPFVWWAFFSNESVLMVRAIVSLFLLIWLLVAWTSIYRVLQFAKYGGSTLSLAQFPFNLGDELKAGYANHHFSELTGRLRLIEEKFVETSDKESVRHDAKELWSETTQVQVQPDEVAVFSFKLPSEKDWGNQLIADEDAPLIRYWDLLISAEAPGIDFKTSFLLPVYHNSRSAQRTNPRFGREVRGRGGLLGFVSFEVRLIVIAVAAVATLLSYKPDLPIKVTEEVETVIRTRSVEHAVVSINPMMGGLDIAETRDALWLLNKYDLYRYQSGQSQQLMDYQTYRQTFNHKVNSFSSVHVSGDEVYIGSWYGELFRYANGRWQELMMRDAFPVGRIFAIADLDGELYLAGNELYRWDRASETPVPVDLPGRGRVEALLQLEDRLLLGRYEYVIELREGQAREVARASGRVESFATSPMGLLIATTRGLYLLADEQSEPLLLLEGVVVNTVVVDASGRIYAGTRKQGLMISKPDDPLSWETLSGLPGTHILDLVIRDHQLWIADYQGGFAHVPLSALQRN